MAIAFCRSRPFMTSTIIGATSTDQLAHLLSGRNLELAQDALDDIDALHRRMPRPI